LITSSFLAVHGEKAQVHTEFHLPIIRDVDSNQSLTEDAIWKEIEMKKRKTNGVEETRMKSGLPTRNYTAFKVAPLHW
jgi:hypothetical protein